MHSVTSNAVAEYINNQNVLSDWLDFYGYNNNSWIMVSAPYDGKIIATTSKRNDPSMQIYINNNKIANVGCIANSVELSIGEITFRKGDRVQVADNPSYARVSFYYLRDYSARS